MKLSAKLTIGGILASLLVTAALLIGSTYWAKETVAQRYDEVEQQASLWVSQGYTEPVPAAWLQWQFQGQPQHSHSQAYHPALTGWLQQSWSQQPISVRHQQQQLTVTPDISAILQQLQQFWVLSLLAALVWSLVSVLASRWLNRQLHDSSKELRDHISHLDELDRTLPAPAMHELTEAYEALASIQEKLRLTQGHQDKQVKALSIRVLTDPLTGLPNRRALTERMSQMLSSGKAMSLALVRASSLKVINDQDGYQAGDDYIKQLSDILKNRGSNQLSVRAFRLSGSDFALLIASNDAATIRKFTEQLMGAFSAIRVPQEQLAAYIGLAIAHKDTPGDLLARADNALAMAMADALPGWFLTDTLSQQNSLEHNSQREWREHLQYLLSDRGLELHSQPIHAINRSDIHYSEILARCYDKQGRRLPTASVIAMAERLGMVQQLDQLVVKKALAELSGKPHGDSLYAINLNALTVQDPVFVQWLERKLLNHPELTGHLVFEVPEAGLVRHITNSQRFIDVVHKMACRITIERFGYGLGAIRFFRALKPDFVKLDASLSQGVDNDQDSQYYLRILVDIAHRLGVKVLAENVETPEERMVLTDLHLDGLQGYFLAKPQPFGPSALALSQ